MLTKDFGSLPPKGLSPYDLHFKWNFCPVTICMPFPICKSAPLLFSTDRCSHNIKIKNKNEEMKFCQSLCTWEMVFLKGLQSEKIWAGFHGDHIPT